MGIAKVTLNGETLMDVTGKTVEASSMLSGKTALDKKGDNVTGSITSKTEADLTASGATVTVPAGYYAASASKAVTTVAHPNPTAAINSTTGVVTATHVQTAGYVTAGTTTGTLSLSTQAAKTVTPTESIQRAVSAGYYTTGNISVAAISSTYVGTGITRVSAADLTASGSTVTVPAGYYATQATKNVASASAFPPAISLNSSTGVITGTNTFAAGYYAASTTTSTLQLTSKAAATYYPSTADQTITSNQYLVGAQTIKSVTLTNLTASNIVSGVTVKIGDSANASRITQVTGTYTDSDFVVTLTKNASTGNWEPDCTFAEAKAAYDAGKNVVAAATDEYTPVYFTYSEDDSCFYYAVQEQSSSGAFGMVVAVEKTYYLDSDGVHDDGGTNLYETTMDTATPSQVLSGARFHNASGYQTGTMPINTAFPPALSLNSSTGVITGTNSFSEGHYSAGTQTSTLSLATQAASTWTPGTTNKTIASGQYLTGAQTILGDANLVASNIASGVSIFGVTGTYEGGVSSIYKSIYDRTTTGMTNDVINAFLNQSTTIPSYAFAGWSYTSLSALNSVDNVKVISPYAFYNCYSLTTPSFPSATTIGQYAFYNCISLTTASFPEATTIGQYAFYSCTNLSSISFPVATSIGAYAFYSCTRLATADFPSATTIGSSAFYGCISLTTASFPAATSIGQYAFNNCSRLTTISFPAATYIGYSAFQGCSSLTTADFPAATYIKSYAFAAPPHYNSYTCGAIAANFKLQTANFPVATSIEDYAFYYQQALTTANFPSATSIGSYAFYYCYRLSSISFPAATFIGSSAFYNCSSLTTADFPAVTSIGNSAFQNCGLTTANFPSVTSIGMSAFYSCTRLSSISFPSITSISTYTFYGCTSLTTVSFPAAVSIAVGAFYGCSKLSTIDFPVALSIDQSAFYNCSSLTTISFPSATYIGDDAFGMQSLYNHITGGRYQYKLKSVYFPLVTSIGMAAFAFRTNLSSISFPAATSIGISAFYYCVDLPVASFPAAVSIGQCAFFGCNSLSSVYLLGSSVPYLGAQAFYGSPMNASTYLGYFGSIYVRESLADAFRSATNWATYSSRIVGLTDAEIEALDS